MNYDQKTVVSIAEEEEMRMLRETQKSKLNALLEAAMQIHSDVTVATQWRVHPYVIMYLNNAALKAAELEIGLREALDIFKSKE